MPTLPIDTLILGRSALSRECLRLLLPPDRFRVVADAVDLGAVPVGVGRPALVLLDLGDEGVAEPARQLALALPGARLVLLADKADPARLREAVGAGLHGLVTKDTSAAALVEALYLVMLGESVFPCMPELVRGLFGPRPAGGARPLAPGGRTLSQREGEILESLVRGESNKLIAKRLGIMEATVKVHLKGLLRKINAANRTQAAIWALANGYQPGPPARAPQAQLA